MNEQCSGSRRFTEVSTVFDQSRQLLRPEASSESVPDSDDRAGRSEVGSTFGVPQRDRLRSKAGSRLVVTNRDRRTLAIVGEQFGAPYSVLAYLLGRYGGGGVLSDRGVRQQVDRWLSLGLVRKEVVQGATWVTLTRKGYGTVGQSYPLWGLPATRLAHTKACFETRIWYESSPERVVAQGSWISERNLFAQRGIEQWHVPDAELRQPGSSSAWAVEVELTLKTPRSRYVSEVLLRLHPDIVGVLYLSPLGLVERVRPSVSWAVQAAGLAKTIQVHCRVLPHLEELASSGSGRP